MADLGGVQRHSAWFLIDVLPLPAGAWGFLKTGELPHHDHGHVDGLEEEKPPVDVDFYGMDDNLHMHDLKHTMVGDRRSGDDRRHGDVQAQENERRQNERRDNDKNGGQQ